MHLPAMRASTTQQPRTPRVHYQRHQPENTTLYPIIEQNLSVLLDAIYQQEASLPGFVLAEFEDYLRCGRLEHGFVRVKCNGCRHEHLVAFSCNRRGLLRASCPPPCGPAFGCSKIAPGDFDCPSCGARRMIETSAHLVDHVFPEVPIRQRVLSFPRPLRLLFASNPDALSRCLAVTVRAIQTDLTRRTGRWPQDLHPQEPRPQPDRCNTQSLHRQTGQLLTELRRVLSAKPTRPT